MLVFALTIFTGAFLLFQVQPLIAKYILPWFGGGTGVWTTCMLFFQVLLLGGYAYAHLISRWLKPRAQALVHLALLTAALALLPITPSEAWKPTSSENPVPRILALLLVSLGLPYFVLSSTGPLIQQWFSRANPGRSPYRLYALSNAGSLLALVSYPFLFEPQFTRKTQAELWAWGLAAFVLCCGFCAWRLWKSETRNPKAERSPKPEGRNAAAAGGVDEIESMGASVVAAAGDSRAPAPDDPVRPSDFGLRPSFGLRTSAFGLHSLWLLLPACASTLLLATTNKMCQDVAVIPFLWVLPLALYLLSFILCFDNPRWYQRFPYALALMLLLGAVCWVLPKQSDVPLLLVLAIYSAALFVCCMICHGELYRLKPEPDRLTSFYLLIAAGGALGGLFVAVIAPLVFNSYAELPWGLFCCGLLLLIACARDVAPGNSAQWRWLAWTLPLPLLAALDRLLAGLTDRPGSTLEGCLLALRISAGIFLVWLVYLGLESRTPVNSRARVWPSLVLVFVPWAARGRLSEFPHWRRLACSWLGFGVVILGLALLRQSHKFAETLVFMSRNFYGVLSVSEEAKDSADWRHLALFHGQTLHGLQFVHPIGATWPTAYYTDNSGVGLAVFALPKGDRRIGVVGLGVGTLAAYARTNDYLHFYEIDPEVQRLAKSRFTYLAHCRGKVECTLGDARLSLEREPSQQFDLLALDAFSGDAIPVHLLTREAFAVYDRHLKTNGVIAVHISNKSLDLGPVLANVARERNYRMAVIESNTAEPRKFWVLTAVWVLLTRNPDLPNSPAIRQAARPPSASLHPVRLWTDDFTSMYQILCQRPIETNAVPHK
jgi:spermidine synthase